MSKARITELAQRLRDAARAQDPTAQAAIELVKLAGEAAKESLVSADGNDMLRLQGAVRSFQQLHRELITTPPNISAQEKK